MRLPHPLYGLYERRLAASLPAQGIPRHVGVILDGNRRWARSIGGSTAHGHRAGGDKIADLLEWSEDIGVEVVTLWLLSTDNLERSPDELEPLLAIIEDVVGELAATGRWRVQAVGALDMLPDHTAKALVAAQDATTGVVGLHVNVAVGYGGRREIADAVRAFLREHAEAGSSLDELAEDFDMEHIADRLYTKGQPDPELVIRTSGEQRVSNFLTWQTAYSEFVFVPDYWPDFTHETFRAALDEFFRRDRRFGGLSAKAV